MLADGITSAMIKKSLEIVANHKMVFRAGEGSGASGSFFFFSYDHKFLIKTLNNAEKSKFLSMIDSFEAHISSGNSLIARIYGIFTFWTDHFRPLNVMIMENTVQLSNKKAK